MELILRFKPFSSYFVKHNIFEEKVAPKTPNIDTAIDILIDEVNKISDDSNVLTIIDPYFWDLKVGINYYNQLFEGLNFDNLQIVSFEIKDKQTKKFVNSILNAHSKKIKIESIKDCHDRFWITNNGKGVVVGTSFNGIGKKLSLIYQISDDDMKELIPILRDDYNINIYPKFK